MIKDYQNIIEAICVRCNNAISPIDVVAWLENFDEIDRKKALIVLNYFEYFSTNDIIKEFNHGLVEVASKYNNKAKIYLLPLGKTGKSGAAMMYYLKKAYNPNGKIRIIDNNEITDIVENSVIIIVDDFAGTGNSIVKFYEEIKDKLPVDCSACALTIAYSGQAKGYLRNNGICIVGNERMQCFAKRGSVFGYYDRMILIREFCFKYGNKLYSEQNYKDLKTKQHPLGYSNSQALIGFEHSIPNNTLPIIWADCKINGGTKNWVPIFPRRGTLLIEKINKKRNSLFHWVNILFKLGLNETLFKVEDKYNSETIKLISIIFLKKKHKCTQYICQVLGINLSEYDTIIKIGKNKGLFDDINETLTEQAISIYDEIIKKSKFHKKDSAEKLMIEDNIIYIPKQFHGNS